MVILPPEKFNNGSQNESKQQFFVNFMYKNENKGESTWIHHMVREWNNVYLIRNKTKKTWSFCHDFLLSYTSKRIDQYTADFRFLKINQEIFSL